MRKINFPQHQTYKPKANVMVNLNPFEQAENEYYKSFKVHFLLPFLKISIGYGYKTLPHKKEAQ